MSKVFSFSGEKNSIHIQVLFSTTERRLGGTRKSLPPGEYDMAFSDGDGYVFALGLDFVFYNCTNFSKSIVGEYFLASAKEPG